MGTGSSYIIEKDKIANNIAQLRHYVGNRTIYAVLKSDGYGLGCLDMAILCFENGLRHFAVCNRKDAETVAAAVPVEELLLLSSADSADIPKLADLGVTFTVTSEKDLQILEYYHARVHVKVDTVWEDVNFQWLKQKTLYGFTESIREYALLEFIPIFQTERTGE